MDPSSNNMSRADFVGGLFVFFNPFMINFRSIFSVQGETDS